MNKDPKPNSSIEELSPDELKYALQYAREDLEDLQLYLEEFSAFLPLPIISVNPLGFVLDVNRALEILIGLEQTEIIGESIEKFFLEQEKFNQLQQKVLVGNFIKGEEITLLSKHGKVPVSIYLAPRKDREGNVIGYFVGIFDITGFKELERTLEERVKQRTAALEKSTNELVDSRKALMNILEDVEIARAEAITERDKTLAIIENFPEGLLFFNKENELVSANPKARDFFGLLPEQFIGKPLKELNKIPSLAPLTEVLGEELRGVYRKELVLREDLVLEISTVAVMRVEEKVGVLVILRNITREKIIERMKTEFVSITAHQLRTPLSAIKWILRMMLDGDLGRVPAYQKEFLEKMYTSNERMIKLINDLLNVTRIEEGRFLYNIQKYDIIEIVEKAIAPFREVATRKGLKFAFKKPQKKIPKASIDVEKIGLIIQNLTDNAIRYTKSGGIEVSLGYLKKEQQFLFKVQDTGIGIPKDQQERVFTRFFRAANAVRTDTEGTGLGLFIAKNIIEAHGGRIWFESEENKGTTFYFSLSLKPGEEFEKFIEKF